MLPAPNEQAAQVFQSFREQVTASGRDPADVGIEATIFAPTLNEAAWGEQIQGWIDCGATQIVFRPQASYDQIPEMVEAFGTVMKGF